MNKLLFAALLLFGGCMEQKLIIYEPSEKIGICDPELHHLGKRIGICE